MNTKFPSQSQLLLPVLETVKELGGSAKAAEVIDAVAERMGVPNEVKNDFVEKDCGKWGIRKRSAFRQSVHWVRQTAVTAGLLCKSEYGRWTLTDKGSKSLHNCAPGVLLTVYETPNGQAIWADAMTCAGALDDSSVNLLFSSPPYPVLSGRGYGTFTESEIIELTVKCAHEWRRALKDDGSIVLNFKDCFLPKAMTGGAVRSLYQEKLLIALCEDVKLFFADRFFWRNPSHLPDNPWITVRKVRTNQDAEQLFWLSKSPNPKANNRNVLVDAAPSTIEAYRRKAARQAKNVVGPSGHNTLFEEQVAAVAAGHSIKVIPRNLLEISNGDTHRKLADGLKALRLPRHDAMMPVKLAEHFIRFMTDPGDLVYDGFFGSGTTGVAAEKLGRRWIGSDRSLAHVLGSALRFENAHYGPIPKVA